MVPQFRGVREPYRSASFRFPLVLKHLPTTVARRSDKGWLCASVPSCVGVTVYAHPTFRYVADDHCGLREGRLRFGQKVGLIEIEQDIIRQVDAHFRGRLLHFKALQDRQPLTFNPADEPKGAHRSDLRCGRSDCKFAANLKILHVNNSVAVLC